jgi:cGMP-dependent protein kinase
MGCAKSSEAKYGAESPAKRAAAPSRERSSGVERFKKGPLRASDLQILEKALRGSVLCKPVVDDLLAPNSEDRAKLLACFAFYETPASSTVLFGSSDILSHVLVVVKGSLSVERRTTVEGNRSPVPGGRGGRESATAGEVRRLDVETLYGDLAPLGKAAKEVITADSACAILAAMQEPYREIVTRAIKTRQEREFEILNSVSIFKDLLEEQKVMLLNVLKIENFEKGAEVFRQGDEADALYAVNKGQLEVYIDGKFVRTLQKGDFFGERALMDDVKRTATITAAEPAECQKILRKDLEGVFGKSLESALAWNMIYLGLQSSRQLIQLTPSQLKALVGAATVLKYPAGKDVTSTAGMRCLVVLDGTLSAGGSQYKAGAFYGGEGDVTSDDHGGIERFTAVTDTKLAVLTDESIGVALGDANLAQAIDFGTKETACETVWIMKNISKNQRNQVVNSLKPKVYEQGEAIFNQGDVGTRFYVIQGGEVQVFIGDKLIRTMGHGDYFGERALLFDEPRTAKIVCSSSTATLLSCDKSAFLNVIDENLQSYLMERIRLQDTFFGLEELERDQMLGIGSFGIVEFVHHRKTKTQYALKTLPKAEVRGQDQVNAVLMERTVLLENEHPFLLKLVKTFKDDKYIYFLTEFIGGGELYDAIRVLGILTSYQTKFYAGCILLALESLHLRKTLFRDLKPENALLDAQGYLKLIDFGCAKKLVNADSTFSVVGTPHYMAPEVILGRGYAYSADVWSVGVITYEMVCGPLPFGNSKDDPVEIIQAVVMDDLNIPDHVKENSKRQIMMDMLSRNCDKRCGFSGAAKVFEHEFFSDFDPNRLLERTYAPPRAPSSWEMKPADAALIAEADARKASAEAYHTEWEKDF